MDVFFLMSIFRLYPGFKMSFVQSISRKNFFLSTRFCWDSKYFLCALDQIFKFFGTIGYGDSYLKFSLRHFKKTTLHAILHDAAGTVRAHSGTGPRYCYMIGRGTSSSLLGHVTGLLFCFYVMRILPSIFNPVEFRSSKSCIVLDIEWADINDIRELGIFINGKFQGCSPGPPKKYKPTKQLFWCTRNLHGIAWNSWRLD